MALKTTSHPLLFFKFLWRRFLKSHPRTQPSYLPRKGLKNAIAEFSSKASGDILDVGCGCKPYRSLFANSINYTGIDTKNSGHTYWNSDIVDVFYDGLHIPFESCSFDSVVSFQVFEHVNELDEMMNEIHRVLSADGVLIATVPFIWPEHEMPYDYQRWTVQGIQRLLAQNGFYLVHSKKIGGSAELLSSLFIDRLGNSTSRTNAILLPILCLIINSLTDMYRLFMPFNDTSSSHSLYLDIIFLAKKHNSSTNSQHTVP